MKGLEAAAREGCLLEHLEAYVPREQWAHAHSVPLLHMAGWGDNPRAVVALVRAGLSVDTVTASRWSPAHVHCFYGRAQLLELLCVAGAHLRPLNDDGEAPLDVALKASVDHGALECVRVLVANGVRLTTAREDRRKYITPELEAFERGVLRCRAVVVAMLRVKRAGQLWMWDKFLLLEIAACIWATRYAMGWQTAAHK